MSRKNNEEKSRKRKETIKDKYAGYGVTDVIIIKDGEQLMGEDGEMHSVDGAFSRDGIIYIPQSIAEGSLKYLNRVVGEEVGEIYAQNNGLENKNGKAQQIGEIFGKKISEEVLDSKSKNSLTSDGIDLSDIIIAGTSAKITGVGLKCQGSKCSKPTVYYNFPEKIGTLVIEKEMSTDEIYNKTLMLIAKGNKEGYGDATRFLTHWLESSGTTLAVSPELFEHKKVIEAIERTYGYFSGGEQKEKIYSYIERGIFEFDQSWDGMFTFNAVADKKNYLAYGTATVKSSGKVKVKDSGKYYEVTITVNQNKIYDKYDWNKGEGARIWYSLYVFY